MKKSYKIYSLICLSFMLTNTLTAQDPMQVLIPQVYEWAKSMGFGGIYADEGRAVATDSSGNVYTTGAFTGTVDFDPGPGISNLTGAGIDIFISKLDADGNFVWAKKMGSALGDEGFGIALDASGNVYITGLFYDRVFVETITDTVELNSAGASDIFVTKLDSTGDFIWAKNMGGTSHDGGNAITVDALGNVYTTGYFRLTADFDPDAVANHDLISEGGKDIFISKLDTDGNFVGAIKMGGNSADEGKSIALNASGEIYTSGFFKGTADFDPDNIGNQRRTSEGGKDIFISKLDASGNFLAAKRIGGPGDDEGNCITLDASGNIHTTGFFSETVDFDPKSGTYNLDSEGGKDIFISKLDAQGNFVWAKNIGGTSTDKGNSISVDANGSVYTTGSFKQTVDFDPNTGTYDLTSEDHTDVFISKLDASGNFIWAKRMGGDGSDIGYGITVNAGFEVYTTGGFMEIVDFDTETGIDNIPSFGDFDVFVHKLIPDYGSTMPIDINISNPPMVFPNPTTQTLTLDLGQLYHAATLNVRDFSGALISTRAYKKTDEINFSINSSPGLYFVEVLVDGEKKYTLKVIKQ